MSRPPGRSGGTPQPTSAAAPVSVAVPPSLVEVLRDGPAPLIPGGAERADSVRAGLSACSNAATIILIHDAARPLISVRDIDRVIAAAKRHGAAILAEPVIDTIKLAKDFAIGRTIDRAHLWKAQTPQGFTRDLIFKAHCGKLARQATDDSLLAERLGARVRVVPASGDNLKVTTPHDLEIAAWLLRRK